MCAVFPPESLEENEIHVVKRGVRVPHREQDIKAAAVSRQILEAMLMPRVRLSVETIDPFATTTHPKK